MHSGVIMYDETVDPKKSTSTIGADAAGIKEGKGGKPFCDILKEKGIICGIKVDTGVKEIGGTKDEKATQGLDDLDKRCKRYYELGCRFAKWRAVLKIGGGCPSMVSVRETAHTLARYGSICQDNGLVPIIEPEILTDGDHDIDECARVSELVFRTVAHVVEHCVFRAVVCVAAWLGAEHLGGSASAGIGSTHHGMMRSNLFCSTARRSRSVVL